MLKNYLLITFRNLLKNKVYVLVNILGMSLAIANCIVAYLNWDFFNTWDNHLKPSAENVYNLQAKREFQGNLSRLALVPMPLAAHIDANIPQVSRTVRYMQSYCDMRVGEEIFGEINVFVDSAFFDFFALELLRGTYENLYDKGKIFINDELAVKYYGNVDVIGKPLTQIILGSDGVRRPKEFIIGGVFKKHPKNCSFYFTVLSHFENFWDINRKATFTVDSWADWARALFIEIPDKRDVKTVTDQLQQYLKPQNEVRKNYQLTEYYLQSFDGMMQEGRPDPQLITHFESLPYTAIIFPGVMALLLLILVCINFTNTAVSIAGTRLKEIGVRKIVGARNHQLIIQFIGENFLLCTIAMIIGLALAEVMVPAYSAMWKWLDVSIDYTNNFPFLIFLFLLLLFVGFVAGAYPAFYVSSFNPVTILRGKSQLKGVNVYTQALLGLQMAISAICIVMGVAFYLNGKYQETKDMGFDMEGVISAWVTNEDGYNAYRNELKGNSDILKIVPTTHHISRDWTGGPVKSGELEHEVDVLEIGEDYSDAVGMTLVSGRGFIKDSETDRKESVLVSEKLVNDFGWDDPIGQKLIWMDTVQFYVVGVVKDIYSRMMWAEMRPAMLRMAKPEKYNYLVVKTDGDKAEAVLAFMKEKWKVVFPNSIFNGEMMEIEMEEARTINRNLVTLFVFLGIFAILMTSVGLYTLVSLNIARKMKQIGVRKVLGASLGNIILVINRQFMWVLSIGTIIGIVGAFYGADKMMANLWNYYIQLDVWYGILVFMFIILIALVSVGYKTVAAANTNPTETLRDE